MFANENRTNNGETMLNIFTVKFFVEVQTYFVILIKMVTSDVWHVIILIVNSYKFAWYWNNFEISYLKDNVSLKEIVTKIIALKLFLIL